MLNRFMKRYEIILWVALGCTLVPLMLAAVYNRPVIDDLCQPYDAMMAVQNGGTLWDALGIAWQRMIGTYFASCGTYLTMFLSYISPMIYDYRAAYIHPVFFMLLMVAACFRAAYCARAFAPDAPKSALNAAALLMSVLLLTLLPSAMDGYYWYSGAVNYTFTFALSVLLFSGLFAMGAKNAAPSPRVWTRLALYCVGFFLLGGANFLTAAVSAVLYGYYVLYLLVCKKPKRFALPFLFLAAGFCISVLAPGNFQRQATVTEAYPVVFAFLRSFFEAYQMIFQDARLWLFVLLFAPPLYLIVRRLPLGYQHWYLLPLASLTLLAASVIPTMYAYGSVGAERHLNVCFYVLAFLLIINLGYFIGLARRLLLTRLTLRQGVPEATLRAQRRLPWIYVTVVAALFAGVALRNTDFRPYSAQKIVFNCDLPAVKAVSGLRDGQLKAYADGYDRLVRAVRENPDGNVVVEESPTTFLLARVVITDNPDDWYNLNFARYYGGKSIVLAE